MTKRNTLSSPTHPNTRSNEKRSTPRRGDKMKLRRIQNEDELTSTEQIPLDIEPDGQPGTKPTEEFQTDHTNQYAALSDNDAYDNDEDDDSVIEVLPPHQPTTLYLSDSDSESLSVNTAELAKKIQKNHKNNTKPAVPTTTVPPSNPSLLAHPPNPTDPSIRTSYHRICKNKPTIDTSSDSDSDPNDVFEASYDPQLEKGQRDVPLPSADEDITEHELDRLLKDRDRDLIDITKKLQFHEPTEQELATATTAATFSPPDATGPKTNAPNNDTPHTLPHRTYAEAAANPGNTEFTPPPLDPDTSLRYSLRINIPATPQPLALLLQALQTTLTLIQDSIQGTVGIGAWDHRTTQPAILKASDIPNGSNGNKDKQFIQRYCDHWTRATPNKDYTAFMKIRFVIPKSSPLLFKLDQIGNNLGDDLLAECKDAKTDAKISLSRHPLSCQAIKPVTVGWLFGSVKSMREDTFLPAVRKELDIPLHVPLGILWKTLRNEHKKQYTWDDGAKPPQALTIEIEEHYYSLYAPKLSNLWKKRNKAKICGLQLRLVPCFSSLQMNGANDDLKTDSLAMAQKQQHFTDHFTVRLHPTHYIAHLDLPLPDPLNPTSHWTLRRYLMKASPPGLPSQRLLVTVDQAWNGDGYHLVTVHPNLAETEKLLNHMIPECLHLYGPAAAKWFTNFGLYAFKDAVWNPDNRRTVSADKSMTACVDENFFGMGDKWKPQSSSTARPTPPVPAVLNPSSKATTAKDIISQRMTQQKRSDLSVQSFGNRGYEREHDGDTVQTTASALQHDSLEDDVTINPSPKVQIDLTGMELDTPPTPAGDDESCSMSTMAQTTGSTRIKLKSATKQNDALAAENEMQAVELEAMESENALLAQQLAEMKAQMAALGTPAPKIPKRVSLSNTATAIVAHPSVHFTVNPPPADSVAHGVQTADTLAAGVGKPD